MRRNTRSTILKIGAAALASLAATSAMADRRPYAPRMSCRSLQGLVGSTNGVVISTSPTTYDRFVSDGRGCTRTENTRPAWTVASDDPECFVGYTCRERSRDDKF